MKGGTPLFDEPPSDNDGTGYQKDESHPERWRGHEGPDQLHDVACNA
jgi:hypothetical protein